DLDAEEHNNMELGGPLAEAIKQTPESVLVARAEAADLESAISMLPYAFREVVVMRDLQGLSYREIAEVTGTTIGTVMSRLARGRRRLIETLGRRSAQ